MAEIVVNLFYLRAVTFHLLLGGVTTVFFYVTYCSISESSPIHQTEVHLTAIVILSVRLLIARYLFSVKHLLYYT